MLKPKTRSKVVPFKFKPFSKRQKQVLTWWTDNSPYKDYDMVIADGAIRSGKTIAEIISFITWSLHTFESEAFILAGKSMGALKRNVLKPMFQILAAKGIKYHYNRSEHYIVIGANIYYCFGANNEASQDVLQGLTAAGAYADEIALFPQSFVEQMIGRCSVDGARIFANCNPMGPYHWFKLEYIDKAKEKRILYLHFTIEDNLTLSESVKERFRRMFTGVFFKRYILGLWAMAEGIIYDMFDEDVHVTECPKIHREYGVAVDYATATVMTFGLYGITGDKVYLLREYYHDAQKTGRQKTDGEFAKDFEEFVKGVLLRSIYIDPSAASFKAELRKKGFGQVRDANNDVINGIRLVGSFLSAGRFFIDRSCKETIKEFFSYVWDEKAQERGEDKPVKKFDHCMDRNRYMIYTRFGKGPAARVLGAKPHGF